MMGRSWDCGEGNSTPNSAATNSNLDALLGTNLVTLSKGDLNKIWMNILIDQCLNGDSYQQPIQN